MAETNRCSACGSTQFRLDRRRNRICCTVCGTSQTAQQDLIRQQAYANAKRMAITHIRRGSYQQALPHLTEMLNTDADDVELYYLHLMGLTEFLKDPLIPGGDRLTQAAQHYRSYRGLGGRPDQFRQYQRIRIQTLDAQIRLKTRAVWCGILLRLLGAAGIGLLLWDSWLFWAAGFLLLARLAGSTAAHEDPLGIQALRRLRQRLRYAQSNDDPFFLI